MPTPTILSYSIQLADSWHEKRKGFFHLGISQISTLGGITTIKWRSEFLLMRSANGLRLTAGEQSVDAIWRSRGGVRELNSFFLGEPVERSVEFYGFWSCGFFLWIVEGCVEFIAALVGKILSEPGFFGQ